MRSLWRLARRDVAGRPLASVLFVLVVAVAATAVVAGLGQQRGAEAQWDGAVARANGADVSWFLRAGAPLDDVAADPAVAEAGEPIAITTGLLVIPGSDPLELDVRAAGGEPPEVATPLLASGRWLAGGATDEAVLDRATALDLGIGDGDVVLVDGPAGGSLDLTVVGTAVDLLDCFYPQCGSSTMWVAPADLATLDPGGERTATLLNLRLVDPSQVGAYEAATQARLGDDVLNVLDRFDTRDDALTTNAFFAAFLAVAGTFLLIAAGLVVATSVSSRVLARTRELGMLKAVGFTPRALAGLVLGEHLAMALVGVLLGFTAGGLLAPRLQLRIATVLGGGDPSFPLDTLVTTLVLVLALVVAATLVPAIRAGRIPAAQAIVRGTAPRRAGASRLAALAGRLRLGPSVAMGVKDTLARPLRTTLTVAALAVTVISLVFTVGLERTADAFAADPALLGDPVDIEVAPEQVTAEEVSAALDDVPGVATWFTATSRRSSLGDQTFQARALAGDLAGSGFVIGDGRMIAAPDEAIVGYGLLERLGLEVGDPLPLEVGGTTLDLTVVGWYAETEDSGEIAQITLDALRLAEPGAAPGGVLVRVEDGVDPVTVADALTDRFGDRVRVEVQETDLGDLDAFRATVALLSLLVGAVGLVNLVSVTLLGLRERTRELGVLKTVGFTPGQLLVGVAVGAGLLALLAALVGIPVGTALSGSLLDTVSEDVGQGPGFAPGPSPLSLLAVAVGLIGVSAVLGVLAARRSVSVDVAEVLRSE
ncbi:MAG: ABC transporter permease [Acidimicrobiales bacterium]|nr:ABC transporter permease [Acidimicrobiales bacterium]